MPPTGRPLWPGPRADCAGAAGARTPVRRGLLARTGCADGVAARGTVDVGVNTRVETPQQIASAKPANARGRSWMRGVGMLRGLGRFARRKPLGAIGAVIVVTLLVMAVFAEQIAPHGYDETIRGARMRPPSAAHWLGTDNLSRDMWSRIVYGARVSITV